ncbi:MAG TPA: DHA2 family efflux MFS transporter permease subunit [Trebonia sp.]|jgi:EmrB/QacA subfamily drug resistance transporter|nr:DHA2 family efflux MFS transporter permease subunit [Trebonia sp.]
MNSASPAARGSSGRWWALAAIGASVLVVGLDLTVLNLALPTIAGTLHASTGDLQWISDSYSLVLAVVMLPAGMLGDRFGRKKVMLIALAVFLLSSVACAYSSSVGELIAARCLLGLGAAAIFPLALSVLPVLFRREEMGSAIAVVSATTMLSFPVGPIVGGYLLDHFWWGAVFLINVPVVLIALVAVVFLLPESRSSARLTVDFAGLIVSSAGLAALTYGFIRAGQDGWGSGVALGAMLAGAVTGVAFVALERRIARSGRHPLVDLRLFQSAGFRWGTILATVVSFAMFGLLFAMPQYFQEVRGADALGSGIRLLPLIGGMLVGMIGGRRLTEARRGPGGTRRPAVAGARGLVAAGYLIMTIGLALGALTRASSSTGYAAAWIAVAGLGLGLVMPSAMNVALGELSAERSGSGSALISALRQVGATIGVAILGTLVSNGYTAALGGALHGVPGGAAAAARGSVAGGVAVARQLGSPSLLASVQAAFVHGMDMMLWTCGGIALAAALLAAVFLPRRGAAGAGPATGLAADPALAVAPLVATGPRGDGEQVDGPATEQAESTP